MGTGFGAGGSIGGYNGGQGSARNHVGGQSGVVNNDGGVGGYRGSKSGSDPGSNNCESWPYAVVQAEAEATVVSTAGRSDPQR